MNLDDLEKTWGTQTVTGPAVRAGEVSVRLERELRSAQRRFTGMIVMAVGLLLVSWTVATVAHLAGIKRFTTLEAAAHAAGSVFYLGWLVLGLRSRRAVRREAAALGGTTRESAAASLRVIGLQIANYRIAVWSLPPAVAVIALLCLAKFHRGELHGLGTAVSIVFIALLAAIAGAAMWQRYRTELKPRREELERVLGEME
jgi:hypothetical protein